MFGKNKIDVQTETKWSEKMLEEFTNSCFFYSGEPGTLPLLIKERITHGDFKLNTSEYDSGISYRGLLAKDGFEDVYYCMSEEEEPMEIYPNCVGFLELLNGMSEDSEPVPMIRAFIKRDVGLFEAVDALIKDVKIFNSANPILVNIKVDLKELPVDREACRFITLNTKMGIEYVNVYHRLITM